MRNKTAEKRQVKKDPRDTQFKKGNPGGPGRPKTPEEIRIFTRCHAEEVLKIGVKRAKQGDSRWGKIVLDIAVPKESSVEYKDVSKKIDEDLSGYTDDQLRQRAELKAKIKEIRPGGASSRILIKSLT